ncbi:MAG: hypothetical protein C4522_04040 [Desulfobacteraceae bacterium]|nr:MAG: hypothetical protein C4522_04040 [Desulfobacteraceae bacterium]
MFRLFVISVTEVHAPLCSIAAGRQPVSFIHHIHAGINKADMEALNHFFWIAKDGFTLKIWLLFISFYL